MQNAKTYAQFIEALAANSVVHKLYTADYFATDNEQDDAVQRQMLSACLQMLLQDSNIKSICAAQHNTTNDVLLEEAIYDDLYDAV